MKCQANCARCCGPLICSDTDSDRIARYVAEHGIEARDNGPLECPFVGEDRGCLIYPARPVVCRLYGRIDGLPCQNGACKPMNAKKARRKLDQAGPPTTILHVEFGVVPWTPEAALAEAKRLGVDRTLVDRVTMGGA